MKIEADTLSEVQEWLTNAGICVIVSGLGVLFLAGGLYMSYVKIHQLRLEPVPCEITQSTLHETRKGKQSLAVQFTYSWEGRLYVGEQRSGIVSTYLEDKARRVAERLSVGAVDTCYVNPSNPEEVMFRRDDLPWHLVVLATFGGLIMGAFIVFMSLAELLRQTKTICFSAEFRNISKHSAISGLSCFVLAGFSLVSAIRVYRDPELWSVFNPWYLEVVCLGIMSLTLLKNRIWAVLFCHSERCDCGLHQFCRVPLVADASEKASLSLFLSSEFRCDDPASGGAADFFLCG